MQYGELKESDIELGMGVIVKGYNTQGTIPYKFDKVYYIKSKLSETLYSVESKYGSGGISGVEISSMKIATEQQKINSLEGFIFLTMRNIEMGFITKDVYNDTKKDIKMAKKELKKIIP